MQGKDHYLSFEIMRADGVWISTLASVTAAQESEYE